MKQAGIETYIQWPVGNYRLDMAYINGTQKIDIEVDGYQYHFDAYGNRKSKDIRRDKFMTERGWNVVRFTGSMVTNELASCVEKVKEIISFNNE
ncbi:hypothetical protein SDC9_121756 [bioreactor metagenome]|uniref:Restriction endonuclease type II-like domain-containing protein n=1 Tax=bioreactor metagenome TaxID=1076179 RepID=A0A645CCU5_9ZZZZ